MRHLLAALFALVAALCLASAGGAFGATLPASASDLTAVFKAAACGDTIAVAPGTVTKWRPGTPARDCSTDPVVITAADPQNPPTFAGTVTMDGWKGVIWRGVAFDIRSGAYGHSPAVLAASTANAAISFEGNTFVGISEPTVDVNGAAELGGIGYGIAGKYQGLRVVKNTFRDMPKGIVLGDSSDVLIADNDMFGITTDNIQFGGLVRGEIVRNLLLKKALPDQATAHPDCIQGLKGGRPSVGVAINDNLCRGTAEGKVSQGVFVSDDPANDGFTVQRNRVLDMGYRAVSIQALTAAVNDNIALSQRAADYAALYWAAQAGEARGNIAQRFNNLPADSVGNVVVSRATAAEIEAAQAEWMAKFRAVATEPEPAPDPRDAEIEALKQQVTALLAERSKALELARLARAARAKNQFIDQIIALLSAPAP